MYDNGRNLVETIRRCATQLLGIYDNQECKERQNGSNIRILCEKWGEFKEDFNGGKKEEKMPPRYSDGSFRVRPNGILEYRFMHLDKVKSVYGKTDDICYAKRTEIIKGKRNKKDNEYSISLTYGEFLEKWLDRRRKRKKPLSKSTLAGNERDIRLHITDNLKRIKLRNLRPYHLEDCLEKIETSRLRKSVYMIFSNSLSFAKANNLIKTELWKLIETPEHKAKSRRPLEDKEYKTLIKEAEPKLRRIIIGYCWTGCRRMELLSIKYKDIKDNEIKVWDQKTRKWKYIPVFPPFEEVMGKGEPEEYVFKENSVWINKHIRTLCNSLKMYDISPHNLRHTFGSVLYDAGVDIKDIQLWLGHSTLQMTEEIYTKRRKATVEKNIKELISKMFSTQN